MPHRLIKEVIGSKDDEELIDATQVLASLRLKVVVGFVTALMVLYSFFGSIYRVPLQLEQLEKEMVVHKVAAERTADRLVVIEKVLATKEDAFLEINRSRGRIESLERLEANRVAMQQQLDRLESATKELAKLFDSNVSKLAELTASVNVIKEISSENRQALNELKRKAP